MEAAKEGERRCFNSERWGGSAVLVVVDAALDSIGLNYFQIVSFEDFSKLSPQDPRLRKIMNNERCWRAAIDVCKALNRIKRENALDGDYAALRFWAESASYEKWKDDPIGRVRGVGLITFQYLHVQAGVDTTMPDKVVKRVMECDFGIKAEDNTGFIKRMEAFS